MGLRVINIKARNFRNYADLEVKPGRGLNVIRGKNAQGKTNFIECLFFALRGYSFRTARESEVLHWGRDCGFIEARLSRGGCELPVRINLAPEGKTILLAGRPVGRTELGRRAGVVLFTPDDLRLVKGPPRDRRRFLDLELGCFLPGYLEDLKSYQRALEQRNHLLRSRRGRDEGETLDLWTEQLCWHGAGVLLGRLQMLREFAPLVCRLFGAWGGEELAIRYRSSVTLGNSDREQAAGRLREALSAVRREELRLGRTQVGPHLDDLAFIVNGRELRSFASQGQQRSVVLALKLAQVALWKRYTGEVPVVLLDDVLFEFDRERRVRVLETLRANAQVFLTVGDRVFAGDRVFWVESGKIGEESG